MSTLQNLLNFSIAHQALLAGVTVGILDLIMALVPGWASNGLLHFVLLQAQKLAGNPPSPPAA